MVHYALLINHLWFRLIVVEVLANFLTHKYELDCSMELKTQVFQLSLKKVDRILLLEGYQTTRVTSQLVISAEACDGCESATLELTKVLLVELIRS